jgi:uncharacterized protein YggE
MENYSTSPFVKSRSKLITIVSLLIIALFTVLSFLRSSSTISTISVTGKADINAKADYVKFVVTQVNTNTNVSTAIDEGSNSIDRLINIAKQTTGLGPEIKRTFYQITSNTTGYSIANAFSVKTSNTKIINDLIKQLYLNGATTVSNVTFESDDIKNVEEQLRKEVYLDAKDKASRIAKSAGKHLGKVISITDDDTSITSTVEDLQNNDGLINISKSASVVYKIW